MRFPRGSAFYAYSTNYLIDLDHAVIVDVEATTAIRQAEVLAQDRFGLWPEKLVADTAYGSAPNLAWPVEDRGIEPHIPVFDKSARRDDTFERSAFTYDHEDDSEKDVARLMRYLLFRSAETARTCKRPILRRAKTCD